MTTTISNNFVIFIKTLAIVLDAQKYIPDFLFFMDPVLDQWQCQNTLCECPMGYPSMHFNHILFKRALVPSSIDKMTVDWTAQMFLYFCAIATILDFSFKKYSSHAVLLPGPKNIQKMFLLFMVTLVFDQWQY